MSKSTIQLQRKKMKLTKFKNILLCALFSTLFTSNVFASISTENTVIKKVENMIENEPNNFTEKVTREFFSALKENQDKIKQNPNLLKSLVKDKIMIYVNPKYIGSQILSNYYKSFTEEERNQYFTVLEKYLITNYAQVFTLYKGQEINYLKVPYNNENIVKTKIQVVQNNFNPVNIYFSLRKNSKTQEWQLYDITAEGVSFIESKRAEWSKYFKNKESFQELIKYLTEASNKDIVFNK